jgi:hypothetical protein
MVAVPAATPETTPAVTVATDAFEVVHTPEPVASVSVVVEPTQSEAVPVIVPAEGSALMVTAAVTYDDPQVLETV